MSLKALSSNAFGPLNFLSVLDRASLTSLSWQRPERLSLSSANLAAQAADTSCLEAQSNIPGQGRGVLNCWSHAM